MKKKRFAKKLVALMTTCILFVGMFSGAIFAEEQQEEQPQISTQVSEENEPAPDTLVLKEDIEKRGEYEKHYLLENGQYIIVMYPEPVHYMEDGSWKEIDNTLAFQQNENTVENANEKFQVDFSAKTDENDIVTVSHNGHQISWNISGTKQVTPEKQPAPVALLAEETEAANEMIPAETESRVDINKGVVPTIINNSARPKSRMSSLTTIEDLRNQDSIAASALVYENLFENTNIRYSICSMKLKEDIVLNAPTEITDYMVDLKTDLNAVVNEDNTISLVDPVTNETHFLFQAPYMYDSNKEESYEITVTVEQTDSGYIFTYSPSREWLDSEERVYPVTIDPTVSPNNNYTNVWDTYVHQGDNTSHMHLNEKQMYVGNKNGQLNRSFIKYTYMPSIPLGNSITGAHLYLYFHTATTTWQKMNCYQIMSPWAAENIVWSNQPTNLQGICIDYTQSNNRIDFWVAGTMSDYYRNNSVGSNGNYGFAIRYSNESINDYNVFYTSEFATASMKPSLSLSLIHI